MIACERCGIVYNRTSAQADDWMDRHCRVCQYDGPRATEHWNENGPWWVDLDEEEKEQ